MNVPMVPTSADNSDVSYENGPVSRSNSTPSEPKPARRKRPRGNEQTEATLAERFWSKVSKSRKADGCWIWSGARAGNGYGTLKRGERGLTKLAHRISWELHNGPVPDGMLVCHRCDSPPCVNPAHLFLGTMKDNVHDMLAKSRRTGVKREAPTAHRRLTGQQRKKALATVIPTRASSAPSGASQ